MGIKEFIKDAIERKPLERIPLFYRGDLIINEKLIDYFKLNNLRSASKKYTFSAFSAC